MRFLVIVAAALALLKLGYQEYLFRASTRDVIIATFQEKALQSCQRQSKSQQGINGLLTSWNKPATIALVVGKSSVDVYFWQIHNSLWNTRYRNPYLHIVAEEKPAYVYCEYDILNGAAAVYRL